MNKQNKILIPCKKNWVYERDVVNNRIKLIFNITVSLIFIGYLGFKIDLPVVIDALWKANIKFYIGSFLLFFVTTTFLSMKYYMLLKDTSISHSVFSLIKINVITRYYALFLPSAMSADAVRWYKITKNQKARSFVLATVIFERLVAVSLLLFFGLVPLFMYPSNPGITVLRTRLLPAISVSLLLVVIGIAYFINPAIHFFLQSILERFQLSKVKLQYINLFFENFTIKNKGSSFLLCFFGLTILWHLSFISQIFFLFQAVDLPVNFIDVLWMGSLVLLLQFLPISFSGIGIREGAYAYLVSIFEFPPERGVLVGILFFSHLVLVAIIGGILEWLSN